MAFKAWEECDRDLPVFPIGGKTYEPPELPAKFSEAIMRGDASGFEDDERSMWQIVLGDTYDQMVADGVSGDAIARAGFAVLAFAIHGRDAAERVWNSGVALETLAAQYEATRPVAAVKKAAVKKAAVKKAARKPALRVATKTG